MAFETSGSAVGPPGRLAPAGPGRRPPPVRGAHRRRRVRARQRLPARGLRAHHRRPRRRRADVRVAQLAVPGVRRRAAPSARRTWSATRSRIDGDEVRVSPHPARPGRAAGRPHRQPAARDRATATSARSAATSSGCCGPTRTRRAGVGGGGVGRAPGRVRLGPRDRLGDRLPGDGRPLRRRPAGPAGRAGDRRHRRGRARPTGATRCPSRSAALADRPGRGVPGPRRAGLGPSRRGGGAAARRDRGRARTPTSCGPGSSASSPTTTSATATARSTSRRRSSCSTGSGGTRAAPCCRTSSSPICAMDPRGPAARTCGRSCGRSPSVDLAALADAEPDPGWRGRRLAARRAARRAAPTTSCPRRSPRVRAGAGIDGLIDAVSTRWPSGCSATTPPVERDHHDGLRLARHHPRPHLRVRGPLGVAGRAGTRRGAPRPLDRLPRRLLRSPRVRRGGRAARSSPTAQTSPPRSPTGRFDESARAALAGDPDDVAAQLVAAALDDHAGSFIVAAHVVKTTGAALSETAATGSRLPLAAAARFMTAPRKERFVTGNVIRSIDFLSGRGPAEVLDEAGISRRRPRGGCACCPCPSTRSSPPGCGRPRRCERTWVPPSACLSRPTMSTTRISGTDSGIRLTFVRIRSSSVDGAVSRAGTTPRSGGRRRARR